MGTHSDPMVKYSARYHVFPRYIAYMTTPDPSQELDPGSGSWSGEVPEAGSGDLVKIPGVWSGSGQTGQF